MSCSPRPSAGSDQSRITARRWLRNMMKKRTTWEYENENWVTPNSSLEGELPSGQRLHNELEKSPLVVAKSTYTGWWFGCHFFTFSQKYKGFRNILKSSLNWLSSSFSEGWPSPKPPTRYKCAILTIAMLTGVHRRVPNRQAQPVGPQSAPESQGMTHPGDPRGSGDHGPMAIPNGGFPKWGYP